MGDGVPTDDQHAWVANALGVDPRTSSGTVAADPVSAPSPVSVPSPFAAAGGGATATPAVPPAAAPPPGQDAAGGDKGGEAGGSYGDALQKVAEAALQEFLKTPAGKAIQQKLEQAEKDIPAAVKYGVAGSLITAALAGLAATHQESPVTKTPEIPLLEIGGVGVKGQITWKGPVDKPTETGIMFLFDIPLGKDPPKKKADASAGAAGLEPSGNYAPPRKEGTPVLLANYDGAYGVDKIMKTLAAHTTSHGGGRIVVVGYYVPQELPADGTPPPGERTDDAAQARADTLKAGIAQQVDASRYKVESLITFKSTGGRTFGLGADAAELGKYDTAVIFTPNG